MSAFAEMGLELLYPPKCPICEAVVPKEGFCPSCISKVRKAGFMKSERVYAVYKYDFVASAVYRLKYQGKADVGRTLGRLMWAETEQILRDWAPDVILPVPLHAKRLKKRGFNQSLLLCEELARQLKIPILPDLVIRCADTRPMKDLNVRERQNNLKKAFKIGQNDVKLKTILIVDDIYTTGTTTDEISKLLLKAGADKTYVLTLGSDNENQAAE